MIFTLSFLASFFDVFINIIIFLLVLSLVICIHELGHLFFAKRAGVLCHEFSFGMGPKLWSIKKGETRYSIRAIPFGGFVSMAGEEVESEIVSIGDTVGLLLDNYHNIAKIILNPSDERYPNAIQTKVESFDLTNLDKLHINGIKVNEKAMYVYVKNEMQIAPNNRRFNSKSKTNRFLITFGGPLMNFILAFVIYLTIALFVGVPNTASTEIGGVTPDMPAYGILFEGDKVISINGEPVDSWTGTDKSIVKELNKTTAEYIFVVERKGVEITLDPVKPLHLFYNLGFSLDSEATGIVIDQALYIKSELKKGDEIVSVDGQQFADVEALVTFALGYTQGSSEASPTKVIVKRDGVEMTFTYMVYSKEVLDGMGYGIYSTRIGIESSSKFSFFGSFSNAGQNFVGAGTSIFSTLKLLFSSKQVGIKDLSGFVGIFSLVKQASALGVIYLFQFVALLSVNLGILNLLPIPALDGGRIVFIGYEAVTRRKPSQKIENLLHSAVFLLLLALMIYVTYNDILRLFGLN